MALLCQRLHPCCTMEQRRSFIGVNPTAVKFALLFWLGLSANVARVAAFFPTSTCPTAAGTSWTCRASYGDYNNPDELSTKDKTEMPLLLPGIGSSSSAAPISHPLFDPFDASLDAGVSRKKEIAFVASRKFELQYTCKICETRNVHRVSRAAYTNGVVIAQCKGCQTQHLIADHLGFTQLWKKDEDGTTIEEVFAKQQQTGTDDENNNIVNRVSREVFDLEKILSHDSSSGSILDENGNAALE